MTHEPGRERHTIRRCEACDLPNSPLHYHRAKDEYWCESCLDEEKEPACD